MQTGWSGPGRQYYFDDAGKMLENQFTPDGYYVGSSGAYVKNGWVLNNGKYYYMNSAGKMVKRSWVGSYYLGSDGVMVTNKWVQWNEKYYYLDSQGVYVKLLFCKWVVIVRLFTMLRAHCIPISHFFWRQNCQFYKF